ncbi:MAG: serine/threonine-protein kinase [bacterium]|nr:serine/threonine-protein kinase [bacterium]MCY3951361.1 serine/threonine-protein kinase [bacterium]
MNVPNPLPIADVVAAFHEHVVDPTPLGEGGMKSAFLIRAEEPLVLKVVREPVQEDPLEGSIGLPERIRREIEGMRAISHPGVVRIVAGPGIREIGDEQHVWYIEPFFAGGSLADRLDGPWPEADCAHLLRGLVDAAEALARHNTVHRDIKPSNIVFDASKRPVLLDLGIAYFQDLTPLTDSWGSSPRTPMYAAPEQFEMRLHSSIDFRTDLFLIGLVIFESLTGVHPFNPGDPHGYYDRLKNCQWNDGALDAVHVSGHMRHVLRRLLDPSMSRRYRRFEHLRSEIETLG